MHYRKMKAMLTALELDNAQAIAARLTRLAKHDASMASARDAALRRLDDLIEEYQELTKVRAA